MGFNYRGYRGEIVGKKEPNEIRIVVLGGSCAYGFGAMASETIPYCLGKIINDRFKSSGVKFNVINLAFNNESAVCFMSTLKQYGYLKPDIVLFYSGYNDHLPAISYYRTEMSAFRNRSFIFRMTGYMPILPVVIIEKYYKMRYRDMDEGYRRNDFVVAMQRSFSFDMVSSKDLKKKGKLTGAALEDAAIKQYLKYIDDIASISVNTGLGFVFVRQPKVFKDQFSYNQQEALKKFLIFKYARNDKFLYADLYAMFDYKTQEQGFPSFDGVHLTAKGNETIAQRLADDMDTYLHNFIIQKIASKL